MDFLNVLSEVIVVSEFSASFCFISYQTCCKKSQVMSTYCSPLELLLIHTLSHRILYPEVYYIMFTQRTGFCYRNIKKSYVHVCIVLHRKRQFYKKGYNNSILYFEAVCILFAINNRWFKMQDVKPCKSQVQF